MSTGITLYTVESTLAQLIATREEMLECGEATEPISAEINAYLRTSATKADGVRAYILNCEATAEATAAEAKRLKDTAAYWQRQAEWMRGLALRTMQELKLPLLRGRVGHLKLRENPPHVEIQGTALIPSEYKVHALKVPPEFWPVLSSHNVTAQFPPALRDQWSALVRDAKAELRLSAIRACIDLPCEECDGNSPTPEEAQRDGVPYCQSCGGSGHRGVPGATLERSVRLEVK